MKDSALVFEWLCGGGLWLENTPPNSVPQLFEQGREMLLSLLKDFSSIGLKTISTWDSRVNSPDIANVDFVSIGEDRNLESTLRDLAEQVDWLLVVAPETHSRLINCLTWLGGYRDKWLNPDWGFTKLTSSKNLLSGFFQRNGIAHPNGAPLIDWLDGQPFENDPFPVVLKPDDGCGGEGVVLVESGKELGQYKNLQNHRVEHFLPGTPVSVSIISGETNALLPPLRQQFHAQPFGKFKQCVNDLDQATIDRAIALAGQAVEVLPNTNGYFGLDLIIGPQDAVIEVNPRITMSYPVLRQMLNSNLAEQMIFSRR